MAESSKSEADFLSPTPEKNSLFFSETRMSAHKSPGPRDHGCLAFEGAPGEVIGGGPAPGPLLIVWNQPFHQAIGDLVAGTLGMVAFGVDNLLTYMSDPNVRARNKTKQRQEELFGSKSMLSRFMKIGLRRFKNGQSTDNDSIGNAVAQEIWAEYVNYEVSKANKRIGKAFNKWAKKIKFKMWPN